MQTAVKTMLQLDSPPKNHPTYSTYRKVRELIDRNNYNLAITTLQKADPQKKDSYFQAMLHYCYERLARKFWRQGNAAEFKGLIPHLEKGQGLATAYARLAGKQALAELAKGQGIEATLAACSIQSDLKSALLLMRHEPSLKDLGEGWLYLLKGDISRSKERFYAVTDSLRSQAKLGLGIAAIMENDFLTAEQMLKHLRIYAAKLFPNLYKIMGWEQKNANTKISSLSPQYIYKASLLELKKIEPQLSQPELRGLLWMTIGDRLAKSSTKNAVEAWQKAAKFNPQLQPDALKRIFYHYREKDPENTVRHAFFDFYRCLKKKDSNSVEAFIEFLIFDSDISIQNDISHSSLSEDGITWEKTVDTTPAIKLFWLILLHRENLSHLGEVVGIKTVKLDENHLFVSPKILFQLVEELMPIYGNREAFLDVAINIYDLCGSPWQQITALQRLLNTVLHRRAELIPRYVKAIWIYLDHPSYTPENGQKLLSELMTLLQQCPSDYDLIRLCIRLQSSQTPLDKLLLSYVSKLSKPLFAVLCFQVHVDFGSKPKTLNALKPTYESLKSSGEALWRWLLTLLEPNAKCSKTEWNELFELMAPSSENKHQLLKRMKAHANVSFPLSVLKKWNSASYCWQSLYHYGVNMADEGNMEEMLDAFETAMERMKEECLESSIISKTLNFGCHFFVKSKSIPQDVEELQELFELLFGR